MKAITKFAAAAAALSLTAFAGSADAAIFIGLQQAGVNSGNITTVASGATAAVYAAAYGAFELELVTGADGVDPTILGSTTSDQNIVGGGADLDIYVTRTDIGGLIPPTLLSTFTSNVLPAGWTVTESTYLSTANALYTGGLLASHAFASIGTFTQNTAVAGGAGPYSVTTRYSLHAPTTGNSLSTLSIQSVSVPEPGTWALMIVGFGGAGAMLRRRRQAAVAA